MRPPPLTVVKLLTELASAMTENRLQPTDELEKNTVGNLAVLRDDYYIGYVDLRYGEVVIHEDPVRADPPE